MNPGRFHVKSSKIVTGTVFADGLHVVEGELNEKPCEEVSPFCEPCL